MKNKKRCIYRQGDVLFTRISKLPKGEQQKRQNAVLAYGEVTGHSHAVALEDRVQAEVVDIDGVPHLEVRGDLIRIVHEEHGTVEIPRGNYRVTIQREYSPEAVRNVAD